MLNIITVFYKGHKKNNNKFLMRHYLTITLIFLICTCNSQTFALLDKSLQKGQVYATFGILFKFVSADIHFDASKPTLDSLTDFLKTNKNCKIEIGAHSESRGAEQFNLQMTKDRANRLKEYFVSNGINFDRISSFGYGETRLLYSDQELEKESSCFPPHGNKKTAE